MTKEEADLLYKVLDRIDKKIHELFMGFGRDLNEEFWSIGDGDYQAIQKYEHLKNMIMNKLQEFETYGS